MYTLNCVINYTMFEILLNIEIFYSINLKLNNLLVCFTDLINKSTTVTDIKPKC